ncbi:MAG: formylglycine-generating enzyme family protein [Leptolyngbyaceae cyanobacterium MO_188.B28]|nr:formylglycine-generating enzyme family protein [Leptolyngbyaceae cyanobacterium MO_188.B28]
MADLILRKELKQVRYFTEKLGDQIDLDMILVPGGDFMMGSPEDEPERSDSEGPQHLVTVPTFFMGRCPVTQAQWRFVAELTEINQPLEPNPSEFKGDDCPVESISWYDAMEFCQRLSAHTTREYRLPSEAEWEYACRAGTTTPFYFGPILTTEVANYNGNYTYNDSPKGEYLKEPIPVDYFGIANAFGLCDMHGNVDEWCQDQYHSNYEGAPINGSAWIDKEGDENVARVLRGGSWDDNPRYCRSAFRFNYIPRESDVFIGFRVVCRAPRALP